MGDKISLLVVAWRFRAQEQAPLRKGTTLSKEMFLNHLYGGMDEPELKFIDVFICKLGKKFANASGGRDYIETVWGRGYMLREPSEVNERLTARSGFRATIGSAATENRARMDDDLKAFVSNTKKAAASGDPSSTSRSRRKANGDQRVSDFLELIGGGLAGALVLGDLVAHLLAFAQITQAGALDRADMNENIRAAIIGLDEAEALLTIEPFHGADSHVISPNIVQKLARTRGAGSIDVWKRSSAASFPKQVQVVRPKIDRREIETRKAECNGKPPASVPAALALNPEAVSRR